MFENLIAVARAAAKAAQRTATAARNIARSATGPVAAALQAAANDAAAAAATAASALQDAMTAAADELLEPTTTAAQAALNAAQAALNALKDALNAVLGGPPEPNDQTQPLLDDMTDDANTTVHGIHDLVRPLTWPTGPEIDKYCWIESGEEAAQLLQVDSSGDPDYAYRSLFLQWVILLKKAVAVMNIECDDTAILTYDWDIYSPFAKVTRDELGLRVSTYNSSETIMEAREDYLNRIEACGEYPDYNENCEIIDTIEETAVSNPEMRIPLSGANYNITVKQFVHPLGYYYILYTDNMPYKRLRCEYPPIDAPAPKSPGPIIPPLAQILAMLPNLAAFIRLDTDERRDT